MKNAAFTSEDQFLAAVAARFPNDHPHMLLGRGDDCAVLKCPEALALTTDLFIEDVHFRRAYFSPEDAGHKALAVNVSDMAAMGCEPVGFSLGLAGPADLPASWWEGMLDGMAALAGELNIPLVGGDLNASERIVLAVTLWGKAGPKGRVFRRGEASAGDVLYLVGDVGLAAVGLEVLEESGAASRQEWPEATAAHLRPGTKISEGLALAELPGTHGLMDVSDGLARDLPRFLGKNLGADLAFDPETLHPEVLRRARETGRDPAGLAVTGGEDYALLGACHPAMFLNVFSRVPGVWAIGQVTSVPGIRLDGTEFSARGFDHFTS